MFSRPFSQAFLSMCVSVLVHALVFTACIFALHPFKPATPPIGPTRPLQITQVNLVSQSRPLPVPSLKSARPNHPKPVAAKTKAIAQSEKPSETHRQAETQSKPQEVSKATPQAPTAQQTEPAQSPSGNTPPVQTEEAPSLTMAQALVSPKPDYPALSRRMREEGVVVLKILVLADGQVAHIELAQSSGHQRLDSSAIRTVARWQYQPATLGGQPVQHWHLQPVRFELTQS